MKITDPARTQAAGVRRSDRRQGVSQGSNFSGLVETSDSGDTPATTGLSGLSPVGGLLSLQTVDDAASGASKGLAHGHDLLDELEKIQRALIMGTLSISQLQSIGTKVRSHVTATDPHLADILAQIELRVEIELAKYEVASGR